jgi:hypothetical protein
LQAFASGGAFGKLFDFPVVMRSSPTAAASGAFFPHSSGGIGQTAFTTLGDLRTTTHDISTGNFTGSSGLTAGDATGIGVEPNGVITLSAEL